MSRVPCAMCHVKMSERRRGPRWISASRRGGVVARAMDRWARPLDGGKPRLSVVVRSYNRLPALAELLEALLAQDHDSFEVVVIEQSTIRVPHDVRRIDELARDPRVRVLSHPPLGGPG